MCIAHPGWDVGKEEGEGEYNSVKATYVQDERERMVGVWGIDGRVYIEKQSWWGRGNG